MSRFTDVLLVSPLADGQTWVVMRPFGYEVGREGSGDLVDVAVGFQTDFASVPRVFWIVLPKWGTYGNAAVIHDWLYWEQHRTRMQADSILREAMGVLGVHPVIKFLMYWAVRGFGWLAWHRNRADRAERFDRVLREVRFKAGNRSQRPGMITRLSTRAWHRLTK